MPIQSKQQPPYYNETQPIKKYTALISQTNTDAPTIDNILQNNTGQTPVYTYTSPGSYTIQFTNNILKQDKTTYHIENNSGEDNAVYAISWVSDEILTIKTAENNGDGTFTPTDGYLQFVPIEITIYP